MLVQITGWRQYLDDGEKFLSCATTATMKRREVFTPEILYNLIAMAIEKFIMGYLMSRGDLADNHTMGDLAAALERNAGPQPELAARLRSLDGYQEICDLDAYNRRPPAAADIPAILAIGQEVRRFVREQTSGCRAGNTRAPGAPTEPVAQSGESPALPRPVALAEGGQQKGQGRGAGEEGDRSQNKRQP